MRYVLISALVILTFTVLELAQAEYYRYTDENGVVCFTDDLSRVPEAQRKKVKVFEEVKSSSPRRGSPGPKSTGNESVDQKAQASEQNRMEQMHEQAESLARKRKELEERYAKLRQEKQEIEGMLEAPDNEKNRQIYQIRAKALNKKILEYERQRKAFEKKVEQFYDKFKQAEGN